MRLVEDGVVSMVVVVHVDDIFCIGRKSRCDQFGRDLNQYAPITNLGELRLYAGCRFSRNFDSGTITISQQTVAENIVEKFGVTRSKETPMVVGLRLDDFDPTELDVDEPFRSLVGHLMCLANQTPPDILNAVRAVARYSHAPKLVHWKAALHILMHIRFTSSYGITFQRGTTSGVGLEVFVDSDFASRATDRRSVSGGVVMCAGACVSFFSRTQKSVTLPSAEEEYVAMAEGFKEAVFLRYIWSFIFPDRDVGCTTIFEDNVGALHLANNPATTPNSKHIDIRPHFLRERVANGEFRVGKQSTNFNVTKPHFCSACVVSHLCFAQVISIYFILFLNFFLPPKRTTHGPATCCNPTMTNFNVTRPRFAFSSCSRCKLGRRSSDNSLSRRSRTGWTTADIIGHTVKETHRNQGRLVPNEKGQRMDAFSMATSRPASARPHRHLPKGM